MLHHLRTIPLVAALAVGMPLAQAGVIGFNGSASKPITNDVVTNEFAADHITFSGAANWVDSKLELGFKLPPDTAALTPELSGYIIGQVEMNLAISGSFNVLDLMVQGYSDGSVTTVQATLKDGSIRQVGQTGQGGGVVQTPSTTLTWQSTPTAQTSATQAWQSMHAVYTQDVVSLRFFSTSAFALDNLGLTSTTGGGVNVPEPASLALVLGGLAAAAITRRRRPR